MIDGTIMILKNKSEKKSAIFLLHILVDKLKSKYKI